jgi:quinol monooxygenase YgiN/quercetin dioxygenase-like cupin family protein
MYGLIGKMTTTPGQREALSAILLEGVGNMPGCLSYVVAADPADQDALWITEVWQDAASHRASLGLPGVQAAIAKGRPLIAGFSDRHETRPLGGYGLANPPAPQGAPDGFVAMPASEIRWQPHPIVAGAELAVLVGNPVASGPYVMRIRFRPGTRVPPHTHPDARTYTVLAGEWRIGFGRSSDEASMRAFPAGSLYRIPARTEHYQMAGTDTTIIQIEGIGPTATEVIGRG